MQKLQKNGMLNNCLRKEIFTEVTSGPMDQKFGYAVVGDIGARNSLPNCHATLGVSCYFKYPSSFQGA